MICFIGRSAEDKECGADEAAKDFGGGNSKVAWAMKMSEFLEGKNPSHALFFVAGKRVHFSFSWKNHAKPKPSPE